MPKDMKKLEASSSSDSDSGPEDRGPAPKKPKAETSSSSSSAKRSDDGGEPTWELEKRRFVKVREFKGQVYVDIREYYDAGGELKPGKKGISLNAKQWQLLKGVIPEVDDALKKY